MSATGDSHRRASGEAGTTLIEALVVVAITGLVSMIAFPRMQQVVLAMSQHETISAVAASLREARAEALLRGGPTAFVISGGGREYGVRRSGSERRLNHVAPGVVLRPAAGARGEIDFYGDGSSSGGVIWVRTERRTIGVAVRREGGALVVGS
jgi:Tfp pilus assembly protein FimT